MYRVTKIINGNTIELSQNWKISDRTGNQVIVNGYIPVLDNNKYLELGAEFASDISKRRLETLLINKLVDLRIRPTESGDCMQNGLLKCRVYLNDIDISKYFLEFKKC